MKKKTENSNKTFRMKPFIREWNLAFTLPTMEFVLLDYSCQHSVLGLKTYISEWWAFRTGFNDFSGRDWDRLKFREN